MWPKTRKSRQKLGCVLCLGVTFTRVNTASKDTIVSGRLDAVAFVCSSVSWWVPTWGRPKQFFETVMKKRLGSNCFPLWNQWMRLLLFAWKSSHCAREWQKCCCCGHNILLVAWLPVETELSRNAKIWDHRNHYVAMFFFVFLLSIEMELFSFRIWVTTGLWNPVW